jgi:hypothetical protein
VQKSEELTSNEELGGAIQKIQIQADDGLEEEKEAFNKCSKCDPQNMKLTFKLKAVWHLNTNFIKFRKCKKV